MNRYRLENIAPSAAERFRQAGADKRREAVRVACEHAAEAAGLTEAAAKEALAILRGDAVSRRASCEQLESLASRLDGEYFQLDEDGAQQQHVLAAFSRARAASALVFALSADDTELHEAIYEALSALDDPSELATLVERALEG